MYAEYENDWIIEGAEDYVQFAPFELRFEPGKCRNLLGHVAEWTAPLTDGQVQAIDSIADEDGGSLRMEWGVFMCPAYLYEKEKLLVVDTSGVW